MTDNLDLKTMKMLIDLNETRNTYQTAERLGLSQSAVARMLSKSRITLNDPLFVRTSGEFHPTSFTETMLERLPSIIDELDIVMNSNQIFEPRLLKGMFQICINRPIQSRFGADLFARLSEEAPNATWYIKSWESSAIEQILDGRVLMGVNYFSEHFPKSITQKRIAKDEFVLLASENHPLAHKSDVELESVFDYEFISLTLPGWDEKSTSLSRLFNTSTQKIDIKLKTDSLTLAMQVARTSNMLLPASSHMNKGYTGLRPLNIKLKSNELPNSDVATFVAYKNSQMPTVKWLNALFIKLANDKL